MFNIVTYMWCNWMRNINKVIQKPIRIKSCVINRHIHTDTLSVQWHPRWVFSPGLQDCSFASWLCETLLLYAFSSLHYTENNCNTWRLRYLLLCSDCIKTHLIIEFSLASTASISWSSSNMSSCCFCFECESEYLGDILPYAPWLAWRQTGPGKGASLVANM